MISRKDMVESSTDGMIASKLSKRIKKGSIMRKLGAESNARKGNCNEKKCRLPIHVNVVTSLVYR